MLAFELAVINARLVPGHPPTEARLHESCVRSGPPSLLHFQRHWRNLGAITDRMRPQPLICVHDVEASSRWYQRLLGCRSAHGGSEYERLVASDGRLVLQLHRWDVEHHHGPIGDPEAKPYGNGVLLWFEVDDFDAAVARAEDMKVKIVLARHRHVGAKHWQVWLRDAEGYTVVLSSPDGSAP